MSLKPTLRADVAAGRRKLAAVGRQLNERQFLRVIGQSQLNWVDQNFRQEGSEVKWRPLSSNTVAQRRGGSDRVLQDTGTLKNSFVSKVQGKEVRVGTQNRVAPFHHLGTRPYTIEPKKVGGRLSFKTARGWVSAKVVNHPGLPARPLLPSKELAERNAAKTVRELINEIIRRARADQ